MVGPTWREPLTGQANSRPELHMQQLPAAARSWNFGGFSLGARSSQIAMCEEIAFENPDRCSIALCLDAVSAKATASDRGSVAAKSGCGNCAVVRGA